MKKLISLISFVLLFTAALSAQPRWTPVIYTNSTTLYAKVTINGEAALAGDKVAAFVNGECRGVADVVSNANEGYITMLIQGETAEEVSFKIWRSSNDVIFKVYQTMFSSPGGTIGYPPNYYLIEGKGPNWKSVIYTNSTTLYSTVTVNKLSARPGDIVGAFVNGECRGKEEVIMNLDSAYISMLIQGESVDTVSFIVWQLSSNKELLVPKQIISDPGNTLPLGNINAVEGLVADLSFDNNLMDFTGNGFDAFGTNLTFTRNKFGELNKSLFFDGVTTQAELTNSTMLNFPSNGFSLSAWVKFSGNVSSIFLGKHVNGYLNGYFLSTTNNQFQFYVSGYSVISPEYNSDNLWHLVTGVYDGKTATLFVDGVQKGSMDIAYTNMSPNPVRMGNMQTPGYPEHFSGSVDDARIYNIPLSTSDITNLYNDRGWQPQSITNVLPANGSRLKANTVFNIQWTASQYIDSVKIEFTSDDGQTWQTIAPSVPANKGNFDWRVPKINTTQAKIRVSHLFSGVVGISADPFVVEIPTIKVNAPNGGELWQINSQQSITWNVTVSQFLNIYFSSNNGTTWSKIANNVSAASSYLWTLPNQPVANGLIKISDAEDSTFSDVSDAPFTIFEPKLTLTVPTGGERFRSGIQQVISWTSQYVNKVKIEFSSDNGTSWNVLSGGDSVLASNAFFNWTPNVETKTAKIRISDSKNASLVSTSNAFEIFVPKLSLTSPVGGEQWRVGTTQKITWTSSDVSKIKIEYSTNNGTNWITLSDSAAASLGSFDWVIQNPTTTQAKVRLTDYKDATISTQSASVFTIYYPTLALVSPNGGENFIVGKTDTIKWTSANVENVTIDLTVDNGATWTTLALSAPASTGSFAWTIPNAPSSNCRIKIVDSEYPEIADTSNRVFSILLPSVTLVKPKGGESFVAGKTDTIRWTGKDVQNILIEFSSNNGTSWNTIISSTPASTGNYLWNIPDVRSDNCKIRISDIIYPEVTSTGDLFTIIKPSITLLAPNGGEKWLLGSEQQISWTSLDIDSVRIDFSFDNGATWSVIAPKIFAGNAVYNWNIEALPTSQALIRVAKYDDLSVQDQSDQVFTIYKEALTVTSPNGGEKVRAQSMVPITWTISDVVTPKTHKKNLGDAAALSNAPIQNVKIEYTTDDGVNWNLIATNIAASLKTYQWKVPAVESRLTKIRISDVADPTHADTSDNAFEIYSPKVVVTFPNGGEIWKAATSQQITWQASEIAKVKIEYSTNDGLDWKTLSDSTDAASGSFAWNIPAERTTKGRVRVTDIAFATTADTSDRAFRILVPEITLTAPTGGEKWKTNTVQQIRWTSIDVDSVIIGYSLEKGGSVILYDTLNSEIGVFNWTVPNKPTAEATITLRDTKYPEITVTSGMFTILKPLTLVTPSGGEKWFSGSKQQIKWNFNFVDSVQLEYSLNNGATWQLLKYSLPASLQSYDWNIPQNIQSTSCRVKISDRSNHLSADSSAEVFTILNPTLTVLTPNGGENLRGGSSYQITWKNQNSDTLLVDYSIDSGKTWILISNVVSALTEKLGWTIPRITSSRCLIRIVDKYYTSVGDTSDRIFSIYTPGLAVTSPIGGEAWYYGQTNKISWRSSFVDKVKIELTTNNGVVWSTLASDVPAADSSFNWSIPNLTSDQCRIKISAVEDALVFDTSKTNFSLGVLPPTLTLSIYQNPVLTQYCNIVVVTDSLLSKPPVTKVWRNKDTTTYEMKPISNSDFVFECSVKFDTTAVYSIASHIVSKLGTAKDTLRLFSVGMIIPNTTGTMVSVNHLFSVTVKPGAVTEKTFLSIEEEKTADAVIYHVRPEKTFAKPVTVQLSYAGKTYEEAYKLSLFAFKDSVWVPVPSDVNEKNKTVTAQVTSFEIFKLGIDAEKKEKAELPTSFALLQNYPNPFNPSTVITYHVPQDCDMALEIFNMLGERIATLQSGSVTAGRYTVVWNGLNESKNQVPSGIYFYRLKTDSFTQVRKMILLK